MGMFDRFKKKPSVADDTARKSALGDDPNAWRSLSEEMLWHVLMLKCLEYGITQDGSRIPRLFALYRHAMERLDVSERMHLLTELTMLMESQDGNGHMGLMMFLAAETNPTVRSSAAMNLAALWPVEDGDVLSGPKFVVRSLLQQDCESEEQGVALGGILLLGDKRLLPLLEDAWQKLSDEARLGLTEAISGFVNEAVVEFWLRCLEKGCSESVFGSVVAAIAKMPVIAQVPFVIDAERIFPAYADTENPLRVIRQSSFRDYLSEIRPRLEALERMESEPKVIPQIYEMWENPERY